MTDKEKAELRTVGQRRLAEKQAAMREFMASKGYLEQIEADLTREITPDELPAVKFKTETRLKLLQKILPDLRQMEHIGDPDNPVQHAVYVRFRDRTTPGV